MKYNITFKHIDHSDALQSYFVTSLDEISRFLLKDGFTHVCFSKNKGDFFLEASVNTAKKYFRASASGSDPYFLVDQVVSKLERQFLKLKETSKNHKKFELTKEGKMRNLNSQLEYNVRYKKAA